MTRISKTSELSRRPLAEVSIGDTDAEVIVAAAHVTEYGHYLTGLMYIDDDQENFLICVDEIEGLEGANFSAAQKLVTEQNLPEILASGENNFLTFHHDIEPDTVLEKMLGVASNGHDGHQAAIVAVATQYDGVDEIDAFDLAARSTSIEAALDALDRAYPNGPKAEQARGRGAKAGAGVSGTVSFRLD